MEVGNPKLEHLLCIRENLSEEYEKTKDKDKLFMLCLVDYKINMLRSNDDEKRIIS